MDGMCGELIISICFSMYTKKKCALKFLYTFSIYVLGFGTLQAFRMEIEGEKVQKMRKMAYVLYYYTSHS
jgi:hypothetical protein